MDLKLPVIINKKNKQMNFSIPKKKISKEIIKDIGKNKFIKIRVMPQ